MPILEQEPCVYPENLLGDECTILDGRKAWAIYTKPRQEKALARELFKKHIPFYLPLVSQDRIVRQVKKQSFLPLFPSYLFLFATHQEREECIDTKRTVQRIAVEDPEQLRTDLAQLQSLIELGTPLTLEARLEPGRRVRIRHGALEGFEGTVLQRRGRSRLLVAVRIIQQGVSVDIDDFMLETID
jgi:transcriptional antiterminator RfaH